ncbi:MAG: hypothetical protein WBP93_20480 [Pyrinomonadaceae bacterium]
MDSDRHWKTEHYPEPGAWQDDEPFLTVGHPRHQLQSPEDTEPDPQAQSKLLELLGLINLKVLSGGTVYIEVNGRAYKVLFGAYWRSVFTGAEHYLLKCEEIADGMWIEGETAAHEIDLAISYTDGGWAVKGSSLKFMACGS